MEAIKEAIKRFLSGVTHSWAQLLLLTVGGCLLIAAFLVGSDRQALASTSLVIGAGLLALGALLARLEGPFELGPGGLKGVLKTLGQKARETPLSDEQLDQAADIIVNEFLKLAPRRGVVHHGEARLTAEASLIAEGVVQKAVDQVVSPPTIESSAAVHPPSVTTESHSDSPSKGPE